MHRFVRGSTLLLLTTSALAQDVTTETDPVDATAALRTALSAAAEAPEVVYTCRVEEVEADDGLAAGGMVMRFGGPGGGGGGTAFQGEVDVWRSGEQLVLTNRDAIPGIELYSDGHRVLSRTMIEDEDIDLAKLQSDLIPLLDLAAIAKRLDRISLSSATDEATGDTTYEGELPKRIVRGSSSEFAFMDPVVLRVEGVFVVGASGSLKSMKFAVIRNDPTAALRREALSGADGGAVKITRSFDPTSAEPSTEEGTMSVYEVSVGGEPSPRARRFKADVAEILEREEV